MSDKLPIFVPIDALQLIRERRAARGIVGIGDGYYIQTIDLCHDERAGCVRYEPAVRRCKTCGQFGQPHGHRAHHCHLTNLDMPADGSGYCSNHPDVKP
jgi:hypothetical protein